MKIPLVLISAVTASRITQLSFAAHAALQITRSCTSATERMQGMFCYLAFGVLEYQDDHFSILGHSQM